MFICRYICVVVCCIFVISVQRIEPLIEVEIEIQVGEMGDKDLFLIIITLTFV